mmetsp:Transcript_36007/g.70765  ORF Transcript_36007/g.70765 Transcript_36007/m.70765 type:complete len:108 (-) Transcript_36007:371-694(-)
MKRGDRSLFNFKIRSVVSILKTSRHDDDDDNDICVNLVECEPQRMWAIAELTYVGHAELTSSGKKQAVLRATIKGNLCLGFGELRKLLRAWSLWNDLVTSSASGVYH